MNQLEESIASKSHRYLLAELLCYCVIVDKQRDSNAFKVVQDFCTKFSISIEYTQVFNILNDAPHKPDIETILEKISQLYNQEELLVLKDWVYFVIVQDSNKDELAIINQIFAKFNWNMQELEQKTEDIPSADETIARESIALKSHNTLAELLCYCIVINKQIHSNALKVVRDFCTEYHVDMEKTKAYAILGDVQDKPDIEQLLENTSKSYSYEELLAFRDWVCLVITVDSNLDTDELQLIKRMSNKFGWNFQELKSMLNEYKSSQILKNNQQMEEERDDKVKERFFLKAKKFFTFDDKKSADIQQEIDRMVLNGSKYSEAIKNRAKTTAEDIEVAIENIESTERNLHNIQKEIQAITSKNPDISDNHGDDVNEVMNNYHETTSKLLQFFDEEVPSQIKNLQNLLEKKKKASLFFSIAFIGRTKAGKSTLHSLLTNEGEDFIGVGSQRTTRFNRIYEKDLIRIIDTPGLDAVSSDDGGKKDEEIALSIIDEVDVICYLVTNDNIEENEFKFLQALRKSHKKVIILLNNKNNIMFSLDGKTYPLIERFVSNPLKWYESEDNDNIQGHINRIERWVDKYYDKEFTTIIPVHLQSAKLSRNKDTSNK